MSDAAAPVKSPEFSKLISLLPETTGHNLVVKVLDSKIVLDRPARTGLKAQRVAECTVADESGSILFSARNEQVDTVQPGSYVTLRNAKTEMFRSSMRLVVDRFGKIEPNADADFEPNLDLNMSLIEYELVQVPAEAAAPKAAAQAAEEPPAAAEPTADAVDGDKPAVAEAAAEPAEEDEAVGS